MDLPPPSSPPEEHTPKNHDSISCILSYNLIELCFAKRKSIFGCDQNLIRALDDVFVFLFAWRCPFKCGSIYIADYFDPGNNSFLILLLIQDMCKSPEKGCRCWQLSWSTCACALSLLSFRWGVKFRKFQTFVTVLS